MTLLPPSLLCGLCLILSALASEEAIRGPLVVRLRRQEVPLQSENGLLHHRSAYYGQLRIGGPEPQLFDVVFDTGSGHLVVPSAFCKTETCTKHRRYRRKKSELAQDIDVDGTQVLPGAPRDEITVAFGTGEVTGVLVQDELCLGGNLSKSMPGRMRAVAPSLLQTPDLTIESLDGLELLEDDGTPIPNEDDVPAAVGKMQRDIGCMLLRIISATDMAEDPFASFTFDGVLGLGLPALSQTDEFNFVLAGFEAGAWGAAPGLEQAFAMYLGADGEGSEISFGGWRPELLAPGSSVAWCRVQDDDLGYWQVDVFAISVDGAELDFCKQGCRAVVDTGTSLLGVPSLLGFELYELLLHDADSEGCAGTSPALHLNLGNVTIELEPADYARLVEVLPDEDDGNTTETSELEAEAEVEPVRKCMPMLSHMDLPEPLHPRTLILGEPVLQRYYTTFDAGGLRVGFGEARRRPSRPETLDV